MQTYFCPDVLWISWVSLAQAADTTSDDSWSKMWWAKRKRQQTLLNQNPTNYLGSKDFTNRLCIMYTYIYIVYIYTQPVQNQTLLFGLLLKTILLPKDRTFPCCQVGQAAQGWWGKALYTSDQYIATSKEYATKKWT